MKLTDLKVRKLKPKDKRFEVADGDGLSIRVTPAGTKSWVYRYYVHGSPRRMTLGNYPGITLALAREKHKAAVEDLQRGDDPAAKRDKAPAFETAWKEFWELELSKSVSGRERCRLVDKDALPYWEKRKLADLTRRDAVLLLDRVRCRAPVTANRLQAVLTRMFNFCAERGLIEFNPMLGMRKTSEQPRKRVLSSDEIIAVWKSLDLGNTAIKIHSVARLILKIILLTGCRPGEATYMTWDEIEGDMWTIPDDRTKNREEHQVPLCPMVLDVLEQARFFSFDSPFVFQSDRKKNAAINRRTVASGVRRYWENMGAKEAFTPHDLRRTVRTMLAELHVDDIVAERVMGHKLGGMLAVYNQYSYHTEKRQALARWELRLSEILGHVDGLAGKVISLAAHTR